MSFSPVHFEGLGLPLLIDALARRSTHDVVDGLERHPRALPTRWRGAMPTHPVDVPTTEFPARDPEETRPAADHPPVGVDGVVLGEYLGGGRQGAVYAARVPATGLVVAVKVIHAGGQFGEERAVREARVAAKVTHPNVLRVFEARPVGAFWVVVMEYLQGDNLDGAGLTPAAARPVAAGLADAVLALARARVVHCDIKPANVVRRRADRAPVLVDFGLALDLDHDIPTESPGFAGSPLYMPPEVFAGARPDPARDAYALGLTVVRLVAADLIPQGHGLPDLIQLKTCGDFDRRVKADLKLVPDGVLGKWCAGLLGDPPDRLAVLEEALRWPAPGGAG